MGRHAINLEQWRDQILDLHDQHASIQEIIDIIVERGGPRISRSTLYSRFKDWDIPVQQLRTTVTQSLVERIIVLFHSEAYSDDQIVEQLSAEGHQISKRGMIRIRKSQEIYRRLDPTQAAQGREQLQAFFQKEQSTDNVVHQLGRELLYYHIRQQMFSLPRALIWDVYASFHQTQINLRRERKQRRRGGFTCPGPNYMWCVDGYMKLEPFGIEIYAGIDAYSRYVPWFYCGVNARTARNVLAQYTHLLQQQKFIPLTIRADRGGETGLLGSVHYWLSTQAFMAHSRQRRLKQRIARAQTNVEQISFDDLHTELHNPNSTGGELLSSGPDDAEQPLEVQDAFLFGTSTLNVKIESWWVHLCEKRLMPWRIYFAKLAGGGMFTKDCLEDRVALLYLFMDRIRYEVASFVHTWNIHYIRAQPKRKHVVHGHPNVLYFQLGKTKVTDYKVFPPEAALQRIFQIVENDGIQLDDYLPPQTSTICKQLLHKVGGIRPVENQIQRESPCLLEYNLLRAELRQYIDSKQHPEVSMLETTSSISDSFSTFLRDNDIDLSSIPQQDPLCDPMFEELQTVGEDMAKFTLM